MSSVEFIATEGFRFEYTRIAATQSGGPEILMLHEGLGCVAQWRDFPTRLAQATGRGVIAYSRLGHGRSSPPHGARGADYHFEEATRWLPQLLRGWGVHRPLLFGHSDGATIALLYAALHPDEVAAVVAIAPHVKVENATLDGLVRAREAFQSSGLRAKLAPYHDDVDSVFWSWNRTWLDPAFRDWNIEALLPAIRAPVLAMQGELDEYATLDQIESIGRRVADAEIVALTGCRHAPHRDQPQLVLEATTRLLARLGQREGDCGHALAPR
ncbi:MAG: alpha/beta hydrolase [Proteobacteria bacterium]|nr:alpha/beta hydrolase [Pseudomonadota bacterium]